MKLTSSNHVYTDQDKKEIFEIAIKAKKYLENSQIIIPECFPLEISHHYGLSQFAEYGCVMIGIINRSYCKKIIILFPHQRNPNHMHKIKEETFQMLSGNMVLTVDGTDYLLNPGELFTIERQMAHSFYSEKGCIFEEISTSHSNDDSYYQDSEIARQNPANRKTIITEWQSY